MKMLPALSVYLAQSEKRVSFAMHRFTANFLMFRIFSCTKTFAQLLFYTFWCSYANMHTEHFAVNQISVGNASKNFISKRERICKASESDKSKRELGE